MSVNLLKNLDLLLRLQPVAVHQQADDIRQVDAEKPGSLGNVFVAGLLCGFDERLDLCRTFGCSGRQDATVYSAIIKGGKDCDVVMLQFNGNVNLLGFEDFSNDVQTLLIGRLFAWAGNEIVGASV